MNLLGKNISANLLSNMWLTALLLFLTPLYIRFLGVESYGLIGFYLSWTTILGILDTGISATAVREIAWLSARPEEKKKIPVLLRSLEAVYWGIVLIVGVGFLAGAWFFGAQWLQAKELSPEIVRDTMLLMAVSLVVQVPSGLYVGGLMGLQRQVECSGLLALFGTLRGLGAVLVLWLISPDIRTFFLWQILASGLQTGGIRWALWRRIHVDKHRARFSLDILSSVKGFASGMMLITFLSLVITQADKMILSRVASLEVLGYYMLAWTVSSGLSRVATPLMQAYGPHFTELISRGDHEALAKQLRVASQLMSALILPPAAAMVFLSEPILFVWTGNQAVAAGASPIMAIMAVSTVLFSCSYPFLSILYSKGQIRTVVVVNLICFVVIVPLLVYTAINFGVIGAALTTGLYGLIWYIAALVYGLRGILNAGLFSSFFRDFINPCAVSLVVVGVAGQWLNEVHGKMAFVGVLTLALVIGWLFAVLVCWDLFEIVLRKLR